MFLPLFPYKISWKIQQHHKFFLSDSDLVQIISQQSLQYSAYPITQDFVRYLFPVYKKKIGNDIEFISHYSQKKNQQKSRIYFF